MEHLWTVCLLLALLPDCRGESAGGGGWLGPAMLWATVGSSSPLSMFGC